MKLFYIARNTFREAVQDRLVYSLMLVGVILIAASHFFADLSFVEREKVVLDAGLAAIYLIGTMMAVFAGTNSLSREIEGRRVFCIFSKPVSRSEFILGKYLGVCAAVLFNTTVLGLALLAFARLETGLWRPGLLKAVYMICLSLVLLAAFACFFSTISGHFLSIFYCLLVLFSGHLVNDLKIYWNSGGAVARFLSKAMYNIIPNFALFDVKAAVVHRLPLAPSLFFQALAYSVLYSSALVLFAMVQFRSRDFE